METSGCKDLSTLSELVCLVDIFLLDYKHVNEKLLDYYTNESAAVLNNNIRYLNKILKPVILRCPIIPSVNDTKEHFQGIIKTAMENDNIKEINILPYHCFGENKQKLIFNTHNTFPTPNQETIDNWVKILTEQNSKPVIVL